MFILVILLVVAACLLYHAEHDAQPDTYSCIPAAMWGGGAATLTTVGYGDAYPITLLGKLMASIIAILGIGVFALPTGIFGAGFVEELDARKKARRCPHC